MQALRIMIAMIMTLEVSGQFPLVTNYNQDFSGLGPNNLLNITGGDLNLADPSLNGWYFFETGANANTEMVSGDGTGLQGDSYNYGTSAAVDRALGGMQSGSLVPSFGFHFLNNTGNVITSLTVIYTGEQWRMGAPGRTDRLDFQYSQQATSISNGLWLDVDVLDFTAPVTTGSPRALDGNALPNRVQFSITIPGLIVPVSGSFMIRWLDFNSISAEDGLAIDDVSIIPGFGIPAPGYFRSAASGEWTRPETWEYSPDNLNWVPAISVPTANAASITIRSTHIVNFQAFLPVDEVVIDTGGILDHRNGLLTISDGTGSDMDIRNGGILVLSSAGNPPVFQGSNPSIDVRTNGMVRVAAGALTSTPGAGVHAGNYQYHHQSVLEFVLPTAFGTVGVTYFPNAGPSVIPIFRITQPIGVSVGSISPTTINGIFEANGNITFANPGTKTFRNGIRGTGNINGLSSGKFIINGIQAELGGAGNLIVPTSGGLEIGSATGTTVQMISDKNISGNIHLLGTGTGTFIETGPHDLVVNGVILGGSGNSYIKTNQQGGFLTLRNTGTTGKLFPVGETSYNPLTLAVASGTADLSVRVRSGIFDPGGPIPTDAVNRTWYVHANAVTPGVTMTFQYGAQPGELSGAAIGQPMNMELLQSDFIAWHLVPGNSTIMSVPFPGPPFTVTSATPVMLNNTTSPYALGTTGTIFLANDLEVRCSASQSGPMVKIDFDVNEIAGITGFEIERSTMNGPFIKIGEMLPAPPVLRYYFLDTVSNAVSRYRVKVSRLDSSSRYSNISLVRMGNDHSLQVFIHPNPVLTTANIGVSSSFNQELLIIIFAGDGREVYRSRRRVTAGVSKFTIPVSHLQAGTYYLHVWGREKMRRTVFVKQ